MKKYISILILLVVTLFTTKVFAFDPPTPRGYVVDQAGKLTPEQLVDLNKQAADINKRTKNEVAALIIPSLNGESIEDVAYATFNSWKVGKVGVDNGVLLVIAVAERKTRIETGKGIGGEITDVQASRILSENLSPHLKKGDYAAGISQSFNAMSQAMDNRSTTPPALHSSDDSSSFWAFLIFLGTIVSGIVGGIWFHISSSNKEAKRLRKIADDEYDARQRRNTADVIASIRRRDEDHARQSQDLLNKARAISNNYSAPPVRKSESSYHSPIAKPVTNDQIWQEQERQRVEANRRSQEESNRREAQRRVDDEDRRRRDDSSYSSSSYSSSSSSWSSGGSSSGGGGDFGGGSSGGGGASGDF